LDFDLDQSANYLLMMSLIFAAAVDDYSPTVLLEKGETRVGFVVWRWIEMIVWNVLK
jgi:hypothetical protein